MTLALLFCLSTCPLETGAALILEEFPAVVVFPLSSHAHAAGAEVGFPSHFLLSSA